MSNVFRAPPKSSKTDEVQLDLRVAVLARPHVQRRRRDFVHQRDGEAEPRQVNSLDVMQAGVAGFDSDVLELRRLKITELRRSLLAAVSTDDTPERPGGEARRADQAPPPAFRPRLGGLKEADLRLAPAERAE